MRYGHGLFSFLVIASALSSSSGLAQAAEFEVVLATTEPPKDPNSPQQRDNSNEANSAKQIPAPVYRPSVYRLQQDSGVFQLKKQRDGSLLYRDPHKRYTATIRKNGQVEFADRWKRASSRKPGRGVCCSLAPPPWTMVSGPTEWLMWMQGQDPLAIEKVKFLAQTFEQRLQRAIEWNSKQIDKRLNQLDSDLNRLWSQNTLTPDERRTLLFKLWDDCDERFSIEADNIPQEAVSRLDQKRVNAALRARRTIEAFIRQNAPQNGPLEYSPDELKELNRTRHSQEVFDPYTVQSVR